MTRRFHPNNWKVSPQQLEDFTPVILDFHPTDYPLGFYTNVWKVPPPFTEGWRSPMPQGCRPKNWRIALSFYPNTFIAFLKGPTIIIEGFHLSDSVFILVTEGFHPATRVFHPSDQKVPPQWLNGVAIKPGGLLVSPRSQIQFVSWSVRFCMVLFSVNY